MDVVEVLWDLAGFLRITLVWARVGSYDAIDYWNYSCSLIYEFNYMILAAGSDLRTSTAGLDTELVSLLRASRLDPTQELRME
jgi:hypothetical protein